MTRPKTELDKLKIAALQFSQKVKETIHLPIADSTSLCQRLQLLPEFKSLTIEEIHAGLAKVTLAKCMLLIALENNASDWNDLVKNHRIDPNQLSDEELIYIIKINDGILNVWFATYHEAKEYQMTKDQTFLFPYKNTFFVCNAGYIEGLGVNPHDPDWDKIGRDWAKPQCNEAKKRLRSKLIQARITHK